MSKLDDLIFQEDVIPKIMKKLAEIESSEVKEGINIALEWQLRTDFQDLNEQQQRVKGIEGQLGYLTLLTQYSRGLLYMEFAKRINGSLKGYIEGNKEFGISYKTCLRYMTLATLILNFPRLALCDLSFAQLLKHKKRLCKLLDKDTFGLRERLSMPVEVVAQGQRVELKQAAIEIPTIKLSTDPDYMFKDASEETTMGDKEIKDWIDSLEEENEEEDLIGTMEQCSLSLNKKLV